MVAGVMVHKASCIVCRHGVCGQTKWTIQGYMAPSHIVLYPATAYSIGVARNAKHIVI